MSRRNIFCTTDPITPASGRDAIGRARTLTPEELGQFITERRAQEIRRMGFQLSDKILRR